MGFARAAEAKQNGRSQTLFAPALQDTLLDLLMLLISMWPLFVCLIGCRCALLSECERLSSSPPTAAPRSRPGSLRIVGGKTVGGVLCFWTRPWIMYEHSRRVGRNHRRELKEASVFLFFSFFLLYVCWDPLIDVQTVCHHHISGVSIHLGGGVSAYR